MKICFIQSKTLINSLKTTVMSGAYEIDGFIVNFVDIVKAKENFKYLY